MRDALDKHDSLFLFKYDNMRSNKFKNVRLHFRDSGSRMFLGKNKLLKIALGRTPEEEYADNLRHVSKRISGGSVGLLFTSRPRMEVEEYFQDLVDPDFARAGSTAPRNISVSNETLNEFPVSMMEQFRKLGMPVEINQGKIVLRDGQEEYRVCKEGEKLSVEKCKLLTHFDMKLAEFRVSLDCFWSNGEFEIY